MRERAELGGNTDTSLLKLLALVFMAIDHVGVAIFPGVTELRVIGRLALPLYAWCLVVGCEYTHDILRYALRILVLAIVSQPINMMALNNSWSKLNILFLLFLGVVAIAGIRENQFFSAIWAPALCYAALGLVNVDYGWRGLTFILLLYLARKSRGGIAATFIAFAMFWGASGSALNSLFGVPMSFLTWTGIGAVLQPIFRMQAMSVFALPLILLPMHSGLRLPKWFGYGAYPLHLLVIMIVRLLMGTPLSAMLSMLGL